MRILLTNDDGIYAPGIAALKTAVSGLVDVVVVAPDGERSAAGHSITLDRPLRVREVYLGEEFLGYAVDGSPADCVKIGVKQVLSEAPDLVLSGVNLGANVGINVLYSGTVAAALEGAILGITSMAVSLADSQRPDLSAAAEVAAKVIARIVENGPGRGTLFNINIPARAPEEIRGVRLTGQSTVSYEDGFDVRRDPRGGRYYWMTGEMRSELVPPESDMAVLESGCVTVTPLQYDLTDTAALEKMRGWNLGLSE